MSHGFMSAFPPQGFSQDFPAPDLTEKEEQVIRAILPIVSELHADKEIIIVQTLTQLLVRLRD